MVQEAHDSQCKGKKTKKMKVRVWVEEELSSSSYRRSTSYRSVNQPGDALITQQFISVGDINIYIY